MRKIIIIDDEANVLNALKRALRSQDLEVFLFSDPQEALLYIATHPVDIILCDQRMPEMYGTELLLQVMLIQPFSKRILISGHTDFDDVVSAFNEGIVDRFVMKPWDNRALINLINEMKLELEGKVLEAQSVSTELVDQHVFSKRDDSEYVNFHGLVSKDPAMLEQFNLIRQLSGSDAPFYINGETGTGKELVAKAIHQESKRNDKPFVAVNCANFSADLLESQLFGHVKGAFTGANRDQQGLFSTADTGTIFLDEIVELPMELQAKLLRVLQEKEYTPLGESHPRKFDCQIISASSLSLKDAVEQGRFRSDLRFRLEVFTVKLPPLRERSNDISILFEFLLTKEVARQGTELHIIDDQVYEYVKDYSWPGNVRELQNACTYMAALAGAMQGQLNIDSLPPVLKQRPSEKANSEMIHSGDEVINTTSTVARELPLDKDTILENMDRFQGNRSAVARALNISRMTLYRKMKTFGIE